MHEHEIHTSLRLRFSQFAFEHAPEAMFTIGPDGRFLAVNDAACRRLEYSRPELLRRVVGDIDPNYSAAAWPRHWAELRERGQMSFETIHRKKSGRTMAVEVSAAYFEFEGASYACSYVRDITERKEAEEKLRRSERLASIGTLAAGIAHEINNPLGMILLEAQDALEHVRDPAAIETALRGIMENVRRCSRIVKSVLQFARQQPAEKWPLDLNQVVLGVVELTQERARRHGVLVRTHPAPGLPRVLGNVTALEQVLVNLIYNAVRASGQGQAVELHSGHGEREVWVAVRDSGRGMTEEERRRAFDPFFSTHYQRGGTGLGLSIAHGIVQDHGGTIELASQSGHGTVATVHLPRAAEAGH